MKFTAERVFSFGDRWIAIRWPRSIQGVTRRRTDRLLYSGAVAAIAATTKLAVLAELANLCTKTHAKSTGRRRSIPQTHLQALLMPRASGDA